MSKYSIDDKIFAFNQFVAGGNDQRLRLDEINAITAQIHRGDNVIVGDASARDIVSYVVKRAGHLGHRLFGPLVEVWAEALLKHVDEKCDGNPLAYVNEQWDSPARMRDPLVRDAENFDGPAEPVDKTDDGSLYPDGYRKPNHDEAETTRREVEAVHSSSETPHEEPKSEEVKTEENKEENKDDYLKRLLGE